MKVQIADGFRVVAADGTVYKDGESAEVSDDEGSRWVANGWASEVKAEPQAKKPAEAPSRKTLGETVKRT